MCCYVYHILLLTITANLPRVKLRSVARVKKRPMNCNVIPGALLIALDVSVQGLQHYTTRPYQET